MIAFDFLYVRPNSLKDAFETFSTLKSEGKNAVYYSGGSEIITLCRTGSIKPDAVIDIKNIADCKGIYKDEETLHIGAACTLYEISKSKFFPLLGLCCGRIADHTNQCRITLGGNLCGTIIYRETSLALLTCDAKIRIYGENGERTEPFSSVFNKRMQISPGEIITKISIPLWALNARHAHIKKTANEKIDYPLLSLGALIKDDKLQIAFSGLFEYPFRCEKLEMLLNEKNKSPYDRAKAACSLINENVIHNVDSSKKYRLFVFENTVQELLEAIESGKI